MTMACITILNLDDDMKTRLWVHAAAHHRSLEEEAPSVLRDSVARKLDSRHLASIVGLQFGPNNGVDRPSPPRAPSRAVPSPVNSWRCRASECTSLSPVPLPDSTSRWCRSGLSLGVTGLGQEEIGYDFAGAPPGSKRRPEYRPVIATGGAKIPVAGPQPIGLCYVESQSERKSVK